MCVIGWAGFLLLVAGALLFWHPWSRSAPGPGPEHHATVVPGAPGFRAVAVKPPPSPGLVLPYSVIPGGVHSKKQLAQTLARDPVVAKHYANFDVGKVRFVRLRNGRRAYVSYRLGDLIFWTKRKIALFKGETLLTDGTHYARARCGNRVSEVPRKPTSPFEPANVALAVPMLHLAPSPVKLSLLGSPSVHPLPLDGGGSTGGSGGSSVFPPVILLPPGGGSNGGGSNGGGSNGGTPVTPTPPDGPVSVPEPGFLLLLSSGLAMLGMKSLWDLWRQ